MKNHQLERLHFPERYVVFGCRLTSHDGITAADLPHEPRGSSLPDGRLTKGATFSHSWPGGSDISDDILKSDTFQLKSWLFE